MQQHGHTARASQCTQTHTPQGGQARRLMERVMSLRRPEQHGVCRHARRPGLWHSARTPGSARDAPPRGRLRALLAALQGLRGADGSFSRRLHITELSGGCILQPNDKSKPVGLTQLRIRRGRNSRQETPRDGARSACGRTRPAKLYDRTACVRYGVRGRAKKRSSGRNTGTRTSMQETVKSAARWARSTTRKNIRKAMAFSSSRSASVTAVRPSRQAGMHFHFDSIFRRRATGLLACPALSCTMTAALASNNRGR